MDVNDCLMQLVEALKDRGVSCPLELLMTPADVMALRAGDDPWATGRSPIEVACTSLVATLESEGIPEPLHQPFTIGMIWLDLCHCAGETPPAMVEAMLDRPAAWPLFGESGGAVRVRPLGDVPDHTATVPEEGGGGW